MHSFMHPDALALGEASAAVRARNPRISDHVVTETARSSLRQAYAEAEKQLAATRAPTSGLSTMLEYVFLRRDVTLETAQDIVQRILSR